MAGSHIPPKSFLGEAVYDFSYWSARYLNVPPNKHRLYNAIGLAAGLYLGRKAMDIIMGETIGGKKIDPKDLPAPLRPFCGVLHYDHFSDDPKDRWMKVFDLMATGTLGGIGAAAGSAQFFREPFFKPIQARMDWSAEKFMLSDAEHRALAHISKPWGLLSGASAVFGSASGFGLFPSPVNYSATLGTVFSLRSGRTMAAPGLRRLFNAHSHHPFRPTKLVNRLIDYLAANPDAHPERIESYARGILKTWFKHADASHIKAFGEEVLAQRARFLENGHLPEKAEAAVRDALRQTLGDLGMENTFIKIGLDPREAAIGDVGFISAIGQLVGDLTGMHTSRKMEATRNLIREGLEIRHPELKKIPFIPRAPRYADTTHKTAAAGVFLGTGAAAIGLIANARDTNLYDLNPAPGNHLPHGPRDIPAPPQEDEHPVHHMVHSKRQHGFVDGKLLDTAEGITGMLSGGIGLHRIHCAAGLTAGTWLGDKVMEALTGVGFQGNRVPKEKVLKPLQKFYKALAYNPKSDLPHDKWMQIVRWAVPGVIGGLAVVEGSKLFFSKRHQEIKPGRYLDEAEDKATFAQSESWSATSAVSAVMGYPTGLPMLPFTNYSTNLGTRYSMASGRKVSLPILGKYWSNNSTLYPFGPPGMINLLIQEAVNNKSYDPELFETYAIGALKPWFKNVTPQQVESFVMRIHEVRDRFFREGGVPEEMKEQLAAELKAHLKGAGLEETLVEIGLDPLKAELASNGWSGSIANALGAGKKVEKIKESYAKNYLDRLRRRQEEAEGGEKPLLR